MINTSLHKNGLIFTVILSFLFFLAAVSAHAKPGDIAPLDAPDNNVNFGDYLLLKSFIDGTQQPTAEQLTAVDFAPVNNPDGFLNEADLIVFRNVILNDFDGDGVSNINDQCAKTQYARNVDVKGCAGENTKFISSGDKWKFLDAGVSPSATWQQSGFDDSAWKIGASQLGYGDGDEATVVGYGTDPANKFITSYFRKQFTVTENSLVENLTIKLLKDDGAIVYVNGVEVVRANMPDGVVTNTTLAATSVFGPQENIFEFYKIDPSLLLNGNNIIAVEIHQEHGNSSDISFDLELIASLQSTTNVISKNTQWKYFSNGALPALDWNANAYDDAAWLSGASQLGYGDGDEATKISYGADANNKFVTTYFRHSVTLNNIANISELHFQLLIDDGAIVYINANEVIRDNMPQGVITDQTYAAQSIFDKDEKKFKTYIVPNEYLIEGVNIIAVEVHQSDANSSDISFDLRLSSVFRTSVNPVEGTWTSACYSVGANEYQQEKLIINGTVYSQQYINSANSDCSSPWLELKKNYRYSLSQESVIDAAGALLDLQLSSITVVANDSLVVNALNEACDKKDFVLNSENNVSGVFCAGGVKYPLIGVNHYERLKLSNDSITLGNKLDVINAVDRATQFSTTRIFGHLHSLVGNRGNNGNI